MLGIIITALGTGCQSDVRFPAIIDQPLPIPQIAGTSVEKRSIEYLVLGHGWNVTFVIAAIHGNEPAGKKLVMELAHYLQNHPDLLKGRKAVLLPVANPDGIACNRRHNARGVDLNRNFPAENRRNNKRSGRTSLSEPEARIIHQLIDKYNPDRIVSIHQLISNAPGSLAHQTPLGRIDYDGPAKEIAERMTQYCQLTVRKIGARPGSLGSYAGITLGTPIITLELPRDSTHRNSRFLWNKYGNALTAVVAYPQKLELKPN